MQIHNQHLSGAVFHYIFTKKYVSRRSSERYLMTDLFLVPLVLRKVKHFNARCTPHPDEEKRKVQYTTLHYLVTVLRAEGSWTHNHLRRGQYDHSKCHEPPSDTATRCRITESWTKSLQKPQSSHLLTPFTTFTDWTFRKMRNSWPSIL
jgi:hypothetical protein